VSGSHHTLPSKVLGERRAHTQGGRRTEAPHLPSTNFPSLTQQQTTEVHTTPGALNYV